MQAGIQGARKFADGMTAVGSADSILEIKIKKPTTFSCGFSSAEKEGFEPPEV